MSVPQARSLTSPAFLRTLFGIGVTVLSWFSPWSWPAWPALAVLGIAFTPERSFVALPYPARATVVFVVLVINVATWAVVAGLITQVRNRLRESPK